MPPAEARAGKSSLDRTERKVVRLINSYRARHGVPRLRTSRGLNRVADRHSRSMARHGYFSHSSRGGRGSASRIRGVVRAGSVGENIAFLGSGARAPAGRVVRMWINSPGHRAVMLSRSFRRIGVARRFGRVHRSRGSVYTADFASG